MVTTLGCFLNPDHSFLERALINIGIIKYSSEAEHSRRKKVEEVSHFLMLG